MCSFYIAYCYFFFLVGDQRAMGYSANIYKCYFSLAGLCVSGPFKAMLHEILSVCDDCQKAVRATSIYGVFGWLCLY